jgi:hypothetical protein
MNNSDKKEDRDKKTNTLLKKGDLQTSFLLIALALIIVSLSSGAISGWWFGKKHSNRIVVIDVEKIVEKRKEEFTAKYNARDADDMATKQEMMTDITLFAQKLEDILKEEGKDKIILTKGAVVSDAMDITNVVEERLWEK